MKIEEIIDKKYPFENVVEFSVTNTTPNDISIDLFNLNTLIPSPTSFSYINPPNTLVGTFGTLSYQWATINPINGYLYATDGSNIIQIFDTNNSNILISTILTASISITQSCYNSNDNTLYFVDGTLGRIYVLNGSTNTITNTIIYAGGINSLVFIPYNNSIYLSTGTGVLKINCNTNTISSTALPNYSDMILNISNSLVYGVDGISNFYDVVNPNSDSIIQTILVPNSNGTIGINPDVNNPFIYVPNGTSDDIYVYNWNTGNTFVNILTPLISTGGLWGRSVYDSNTNSVYFASNSGYLAIVNNNQLQTSFIGFSFLLSLAINEITNSIYATTPFLNSISQITITGIANTPYYITGAINYNTFLQNIENEPIQVFYIRIISNQNQLSKVAQILEVDANGNERQIPHFPILGVSAWQEQGKIGYIDFEGKLILDGRTYLSDYILGGNQNIVLEIHYSQLNRDIIKSLTNSLFPKKKQLKDILDDFIEI